MTDVFGRQTGIGVRSYIPTFRRSPKPGSGLAVRQIHRARARDLTARELVEHIVVEARAVAEGVDERELHYDFFIPVPSPIGLVLERRIVTGEPRVLPKAQREGSIPCPSHGSDRQAKELHEP